jgi:4-amino-4-deoxy-L-arabinose transferase-like glycosyltransferase
VSRPSNWGLALLLAIFTLVFLILTAPDIGLTWDEPTYIEASEFHVSWLRTLAANPRSALSDQGIRDYWEFNHEHPPFDKVWSGLFWAGSRWVLDDLTAHRLGNMIISAGLIALLFLLTAEGYGRTAGFAAAVSLLTMPRFFFHAHLAALDIPVTTSILLVVYLFWRTVDLSGVKWGLLLGGAFGIALGTKINAFVMLPTLLGAWTILFRRRLSMIARLAMMVLVGLIIWLFLWPWLYHDTLQRAASYFDFMTVKHYEIEQYYHGHWLSPPPWHFPFLMTLMVVPLTLTILAAVGTIRILVDRPKDQLGWLLIGGSLIPILILASGTTQVFDNDRLLMPSFPFIAALAGIGFFEILRRVRELAIIKTSRTLARLTIPGLLGMVFLPHLLITSGLYPHLLSYYSETIGGLSGAKLLKMETTYWAETYASALPYLNSFAPAGSRIWVEANDVMLYYQKQGQLRSDLRVVSDKKVTVIRGAQVFQATLEQADLIVIEYRESGFTNQILDLVRTQTPDYVLSNKNVPLLAIFSSLENRVDSSENR